MKEGGREGGKEGERGGEREGGGKEGGKEGRREGGSREKEREEGRERGGGRSHSTLVLRSSHSQRKKSSPYHIWDGQYKVPPHVHHLFEHAVQCHPHNGRKHSLK